MSVARAATELGYTVPSLSEPRHLGYEVLGESVPADDVGEKT